MGSGWKSAALRVGTASIFQRRAALRTAGSVVPAAIWSAACSISPHMGPTSERIRSRTWLAFAATSVSARLSIFGWRMETAQPTEDASSAIQRARPAMARAVTRPQRAVVLGLDISLPLPGRRSGSVVASRPAPAISTRSRMAAPPRRWVTRGRLFRRRSRRPTDSIRVRRSCGPDRTAVERVGRPQSLSLAGRSMPSFFMRNCSVERLRPRRSAALPGPATFQLHSASTARMWARSTSSRVPLPAARTSSRAVETSDRVGSEGRALGEDERALDHVLELAHVAGPCVRRERAHEAVGHPLYRLAHPALLAGDEVPDEERDVLGPVAQRREADREDAEAVVEVGPEAPLAHLALDVAVRGGDDPHVGPLRPRRAEPLELAALEDPQELRLDLEGELGDLVEEDRAPVGDLEPAERALQRAGEGPALVAEQLALDERGGQGGAVDRDDRPVAAAAAVVEGEGDEVLSGARLAEEEDRRVGRGHLLDLAQHAAEGGAAADDRLEAVHVPHLLVQDHVLRLEPLFQGLHLAEASLERSLRLLPLRDVGVHDEGARLLVEGDGVDQVVPHAVMMSVRVGALERRAEPFDHRADPVDDAARARVRLRHPGERGEVVHPVDDLGPDVRRQAAARRLVHGDQPTVAVEHHDLARQGAEDGAVQPLGGRDALLRTVTVEGLGDDAGEQLHARQELARPDANLRDAGHPEGAEDAIADRHGQHRVRPQARPSRELPFGLRLRRQFVDREVEHQPMTPPDLLRVPGKVDGEVLSLKAHHPGP